MPRAPRPRHDGPLFITCQRIGCEKVKQVRDRRRQRLQQFCSLSCGAKARTGNPGTFEARQRGGKAAGRLRRLAVLERVEALTPLAAFRLGYMRGLQSKHRQIKRHKKQKRALRQVAA